MLVMGLVLAGALTVFLMTAARPVVVNWRMGCMYAVLVVLLIASGFRPRATGVGMAVLAAVSIPLSWTDRVSPFALTDLIPWTVAWLVGTLAYSARLKLSIPCLVVIVLSFVLPRRGFLFQALPFIPDSDDIMACIAAFAAGYALQLSARLRRQMQQENELLRLRAKADQLDFLQLRVRSQRVIHDSVAGDLAYIALSTRHVSRESLTDEDIDVIHRHAMSALTHVRKAISILEPSGEQKAVNDMKLSREISSSLGGLHTIVTAADDDLRRLGFIGNTTIEVPGDMNGDAIVDLPQNESGQVVHALLHEIYANILAHGRADGGTYHVSIHFAPHEIRIREENEVGERTDTNGLFSSGTGLQEQKKHVEGLGGTLDTFIEDSHFRLFAEIPTVQN